jgi:ABC-type transport system involved in multi-copper enzyme maturation permease subunit
MQHWFTVNGVLGALTFVIVAGVARYRLAGRPGQIPLVLLCLSLASAFGFRAIRSETHSPIAAAMIWVSFASFFCCIVWGVLRALNSGGRGDSHT